MANAKHIIALDAGTTSVKTALFDLDGTMKARAVEEYALETPSPDVVEVDPEIYWVAARAGIAKVLRDSLVPGDDVAAVGVTSQGESLIVLDADGRPLRKTIVWLDNRSGAEAKRVAERFDRRTVYEITGQQEIVPTWTATKILWLRNHEPETFKRAAKFLMVEDYLIFRLTGERATAHSLCPSTLYYDLRHGSWWDEMLDFLEISTDQLPTLTQAGDVVGPVTADLGLGNAVATTAPIDQIAAAVGSGNVAPGIVTETTGSALAICATLPEPVYDPKMRVGLYRHAVPGHYVLMPWVPTAGMILRWFRDTFTPESSYEGMSDLAAAAPVGCDGLIMLPHLSGAFCPVANPAARGAFHGITMAHGRGHFVRAIMEAVAFMLRDNVEVVEDLGVNCRKIVALGGGAKSAAWLQIKADVLNRPVAAPAVDEATCLGTAILAAHKTGASATLAEAIGRMVRIERETEPEPETATRYEEAYRRYLELNDLLMPTWRQI